MADADRTAPAGTTEHVGLTHDAGVLSAVFDALPELVFVLDRDGRYVDVLGGRDDTRYHDGRALIGKRLHDVLPEDRADEFLARIREALDTGAVVRHEYRLSVHDVDGVDADEAVPDDLWFEGHAAPVASDIGRDDLVVWLAFNVTAARQAARELEALSLARQRLLSVVSHDLRGPLTSIRGFLELLDSRWDDLEPEQARDLLRRGVARAARMDDMIGDMLTASQLEQVELTVAAADVQLADAVATVLDGGHRDDLPVEVEVDGLRVVADPTHVERILTNLLDNAAKYGTPPIRVAAEQRGDVVRIEVHDHGDGVPTSFVPDLFAAYTQAQDAPASGGGIGLGLSIVQQLAQANRGTITYEPTETGACFVVTLPTASTA